MKRKIKTANLIKLEAAKRKIEDTLNEDAQGLKEALLAMIEELEAEEVEFDEDALKEAVKKALEGADELPEKIETEIVECVHNALKRVQNAIPANDRISVKVRNQIAGAILRAHGKEEVENAVNAVLVRNDITGLTFADVVDYSIVAKIEDFNPLFGQLHRTMYNKFFYTEADMATATAIAKQWDKTGTAEKKIQELAAVGKSLNTKYIYKRQRVAFEDLDVIEEAGETSNFLKFINEELDRQIVNTIVMAILIGDTVNATADRVTTFETIATKTASDLFTTIVSAEGDAPTVADIRKMCDAVKNPEGKAKVLVLSQANLTALSAFQYAAGGTVDYRPLDVMKGVFGVDDIYITDLLEQTDDVHAVCLLPDGYWYKERAVLDVAYPTYERNAMNYQKERNAGGAIHDLYSTAVLKAAASAEE